jgi:hypothetical protein
MTLFDINGFPIPKIKLQKGSQYQLRNDEKLCGDFAGMIEANPRNVGTSAEQYFVSYGPGSYERDCINLSLFAGAILIDS